MKRPIVFLATLLLASPSFAAQRAPRPLKVLLKARELPLSVQKSVTNGVSFRSVPSKDTPVGFDSLFQATFGQSKVRILHKGLEADSLKLFFWPERGNKVELPRLGEATSPYYPAFGPLDLKGLPPITFHLYYPPKGPSLEAWKNGARTLYALSMEGMEGEAEIDGKMTRIALFDRDADGNFSEFCTASERDGDWLLLDLDGNGSFEMTNLGKEARGLTRFVVLGDFVWSVACKGKELTLKPVALQKLQVKLDGFSEGDLFRGWSYATGAFEVKLGAGACAEIDRENFSPLAYEAVRGEWRLVGNLRVLRVQEPPAAGTKILEAGPKLVCSIVRNPDPAGDKYVFKCVGRAGDSVTLYKAGKRIEPVFVVRDGSGAEVFRKTQAFG